MDFSEIGVKSRKTGLKAKENVKRDQHNMEDVDDFFNEDQTRNTTQRSQQPLNLNGRIIFPPSNNESNQTNLRNSPLLSPLPAHLNDKPHSTADIFQNRQANNNSDDSDQFDDAIENPQDIQDNDDNDDMDIDEESRGDIKMIDNEQSFNQDFDYSFGNNNNVDDYNKVYPSKDNKKQTLFVDPDASSSDDNSNEKSYSQRQQELEKNLTIRSSARKANSTSNNSIYQSPIKSKPIAKTPSKISSRLSSRPSSKSISSISKNIVLNRNTKLLNKPTTPIQSSVEQYYDDDADDAKVLESVSETDSEDDIPQTLEPSMPSLPNDSGSDIVSDDSEEQVKTKRRKSIKPKSTPPTRSRGIARPKIRNDRVNKFNRDEPESPSSREHIIDINRLRKEQESRSQSRNQETHEQPTRRSSRVRIPPLAFWRNERAVYEKSRGEQLPTLKKIITVDDKIEPLPSRPSSKAPSRSVSKVRSRNGYNSNPRTPGRSNRFKNQQPPILEDEEDEDKEDQEEEQDLGNGAEWLREGYLNVKTFEGHGSDVKNQRLIAWGPGTETYTSEVKSSTDNFKLAILFDKNRDFIATGMMLIPPGGIKSLKGTDTTYFVFYCISGIIEVTLSGTVFIIKKGCSLEIPMGNFYQFINKGKKDASLFFVQTRGQIEDEWDDE